MKQITDFPRVHLGILPTPLQKLENVSREFGKNIYLKRDDMTGVALGGNKVRKLEFLLADAMEKGVDTVMTTGQAQSNHAMLTAACANKLGMKTILMLKKRGVTDRKGNQILNQVLNAQVEFYDTDSYADIYEEMARRKTQLDGSPQDPACRGGARGLRYSRGRLHSPGCAGVCGMLPGNDAAM